MDDIELQEIAKSMEDLISQLNDQQSQTDDVFEYPLRDLLGLDKQLRISIRGSLKVEVAKICSVRRMHQERALQARGDLREPWSLR